MTANTIAATVTESHGFAGAKFSSTQIGVTRLNILLHYKRVQNQSIQKLVLEPWGKG